MSRNPQGFEVKPAEGGKVGATTVFPYDRMTVERFRAAFPRARWRDDLKAWFVPGVRAVSRLDRWLDRELGSVLAYADERGRDAFRFEPIESPYLAARDDIEIRTPYSRTIIEELRKVPWARWDEEMKAWRVPYRSWHELSRFWPAIEEAARRNEPETRRRRHEERRGTAEHEEAKVQASERRRHRYPVPAGDLPPPDRIVMTIHGAVLFIDVTGEIAEDAIVSRFYPGIATGMGTLVWGLWRKPTHAELVAAWPSHWPPSERELARGWWSPTLDELREERRKTRSSERARATRAAGGTN
ncbi:hypothetical protein LMIY3S_01471 [Labrys miyagiensis]